MPIRSMSLPGVLKRIASLLPWAGTGGTAFGGFAMLCCFGWTGLASLLPLVGLGVLVRFGYALRLIWIALAVLALGLGISFRRHRRPWPASIAALGAGLTLYPMYHALEVSLWLGLLYSGLAVLFLGAGMDLWFSLRAPAKSCRPNTYPEEQDLQSALRPAA